MIDRSRRNFLKTSTAAAGLSLIRSLAQRKSCVRMLPPMQAQGQPPFRWARSASLPASSRSRRRSMRATSIHFPSIGFCIRFGSPPAYSSSATPYKGWEDPACELRGHFAGGHFLSAVALASATSGNEVLKRKGDELVSGLAQCQKKDRERISERLPGRFVRTPRSGKTGLGALLHLPQDHGRPA